jgi:hypothetical protein
MSWRGTLYIALTTAALIGAAAAIVGLYQSGPSSLARLAQSVQPGPLSAKHAFLEGKCETCHTPTRGVQAMACIGCHATAAADLGKPSTAFHATANDCRNCHIEHAGAARPTRMDHAMLLKIGSPPTAGRQGHPSVSQGMADDLKRFLGLPVSQSAEKTMLDCKSCHGNRDPHRELFGTGCANCHETTNWRVAGFLHPSPASQECAQCHQAPPSHYMGHFAMMDQRVTGHHQAKVNECFLCHQTDSFNNIKGVGWFKHH